MLLSLVALAASAVSVQAFRDTSPFILFSNSPFPESFKDVSTQQIQSKSSTLDTAKRFLSTCPSDIYYVIEQPSVSYQELSSSAAHLKTALSNPSVHARYTVNEVVGLNTTDAQDLASFIQGQCGAETVDTDIASVMKQRNGPRTLLYRDQYSPIPAGRSTAERADLVLDTDSSLYPILSELPRGQKYTFIYMTSPAAASVPERTEQVRYESHFDDVVHMDLKRNLQARAKNTTGADLRPLFEKYAFFSPGIFMGLVVGLLLIAILSVGMSALGSLEVSYGAFDKEMGPAAQKKQQ